MHRVLFCLLVWLSFVCLVSAQVITGKVTDQDDQPIPYVRVFTSTKSHQALTDKSGRYSLPLPAGDYTIKFKHLRFQEVEIVVEVQGEDIQQDIQLVSIDLQLETVEIQADKKDPAYAVMKQVIANKKAYLKQFESFSRETYLKISLESDTILSRKKKQALIDSLGIDAVPEVGENKSITDLVESQATNYFKAPGKYKSIVNAYRNIKKKTKDAGITIDLGTESFSGDYQTQTRNPYLFYQDATDAEFNFYQNLITVIKLGDRPFVSPLNGTLWQLVYKYKLEETFYVNGRVNYRILVTPKSQEGPYFQGEMIIEDDTWAIKSVDFDVLPSTLSFFTYFHLSHEYTPTSGGRRTLIGETYTYELKEGKVRFYGETVATHRNYDLDIDLPKNFFRNELKRTEIEAFEKDSADWAAIRPIALNTYETDFIEVQDSIDTYLRSEENLYKIDSTYNHISLLDLAVSGISWRQRAKGMEYYINSLLEQIQVFGVGGYRHELGGSVAKTWKRGYRLQVDGYLDYGFTNQDLKGEVKVAYTYLPRRFGRAFVKFGDRYDFVNPNETIAAIFSRGNYINKVFGGAGHVIEIFNGFTLSAEVEFADRKAIDELELSRWSEQLFGETNRPPDFEPYREFLLEFKIRYTPGQKYQMEPYRKVLMGSKWPTFQLLYKKSIPGVFGSDMNFDFMEIRADQEIRLGTLGTTRWNVRAGKFLQANNVQFTDYKFFRGSDPFLFANPLQVFQLLGNTISTPNAYVQANYLHDFAGALIDKVPLLNRTPLQITAGGGTLAVQDGNLLHTELFAGIQWPFRIRRQRFKVGIFYVTSYSNNSDAIQYQPKIGINFFNPSRNRWMY